MSFARANFTNTPWWTVIAPMELSLGSAFESLRYVWVATGPLGCQSGVEQQHGVAEQKARAAAYILSNGKDQA